MGEVGFPDPLQFKPRPMHKYMQYGLVWGKESVIQCISQSSGSVYTRINIIHDLYSVVVLMLLLVSLYHISCKCIS